MLKKTLFAIVFGALIISCSSNNNEGDVNVGGGVADENIVGLEVSVNDPGFVRVAQPLSDLSYRP